MGVQGLRERGREARDGDAVCRKGLQDHDGAARPQFAGHLLQAPRQLLPDVRERLRTCLLSRRRMKQGKRVAQQSLHSWSSGATRM